MWLFQQMLSSGNPNRQIKLRHHPERCFYGDSTLLCCGDSAAPIVPEHTALAIPEGVISGNSKRYMQSFCESPFRRPPVYMMKRPSWCRYIILVFFCRFLSLVLMFSCFFLSVFCTISHIRAAPIAFPTITFVYGEC